MSTSLPMTSSSLQLDAITREVCVSPTIATEASQGGPKSNLSAADSDVKQLSRPGRCNHRSRDVSSSNDVYCPFSPAFFTWPGSVQTASTRERRTTLLVSKVSQHDAGC